MAFVKSVCYAASLAGAVAMMLAPAGCNSPYPEEDEGEKVLYTTFGGEPQHMDPARSYSAGTSIMLGLTLEQPFQYHYLKRPTELDPMLVTEVPKSRKEKVKFDEEMVDATVYTFHLKTGVRYQDHPCFVEANRRVTNADLDGVDSIADFSQTATREVVAADMIHAVRRLADSRLACPIYPTLAKALLGMTEYQEHLDDQLEQVRQDRKDAAGAFYVREQDEKYDPIQLDYSDRAEEFPFVRPVPGDPYAFELVLKKPYPLILYWMSMTFFSPVPPEAIAFYSQPALLRRSIEFDKNPVGTGPYTLDEFDPTNQIVFARNKNYRRELYPARPVAEENKPEQKAIYEAMAEAGVFEAAGQPLPMTDRIVFRMEKEAIPRWNKFLQGYYDGCGVDDDVFDQTVTLTSRGDPELTDEMAERGIRLLTSYSVVIYYFAFNMSDPVVGGYTEEKRKLRRAISIAFDTEEQITVFINGRGVPAHSPIPPGVFGHATGAEGINPFVYERWDSKRHRGVRRSIKEAKGLLAEAGYPDGRGPDGKKLTITYVTPTGSADARSRIKFLKKQLAKLNIQLVIEATDGNRVQEKLRTGNWQFIHGGWLADYPDPENFLFLLYGPNSVTVDGGPNVTDYQNEEYDKLFEKMESMENTTGQLEVIRKMLRIILSGQMESMADISERLDAIRKMVRIILFGQMVSMEDTPERLKVIRKMVRIIQEDSPWVFEYHPESYGLYHSWLHNVYPHPIASNRLIYQGIDVAERAAYRREQNRPRWWPVAILGMVLVIFTIPGVVIAIRQFREA